MAVSKAQQRATAKYVKANYDRMEIVVPKGTRETIKNHAATHGESVGAFIKRAIDGQMERDALPKEVIFCRAVDIIAEHYEVAYWDVLNELKGLGDKGGVPNE